MSDITYSYCIENLRYIHKIIGIDALIKEAMFIEHLSKHSKIDNKIEHVNVEPFSESNIVEHTALEPNLKVDISESIPENKNIVINPQKYIRTVLSDDCKCECITNNGQRCTLKKSKDSKYCSRHISNML